MQARTLHASVWSCITQIGHAPPLTSSSSAVVVIASPGAGGQFPTEKRQSLLGVLESSLPSHTFPHEMVGCGPQLPTGLTATPLGLQNLASTPPPEHVDGCLCMTLG